MAAPTTSPSPVRPRPRCWLPSSAPTATQPTRSCSSATPVGLLPVAAGPGRAGPARQAEPAPARRAHLCPDGHAPDLLAAEYADRRLTTPAFARAVARFRSTPPFVAPSRVLVDLAGLVKGDDRRRRNQETRGAWRLKSPLIAAKSACADCYRGTTWLQGQPA